MSDIITEHNLFKPKPIKQSKADITNHAARAIIGDEAERREAKTARPPQGAADSRNDPGYCAVAHQDD